MSINKLGQINPANPSEGGGTVEEPPPPPPTEAQVTDLEARSQAAGEKLTVNPSDTKSIEDLKQVRADTLKALEGENAKPGGGDPATLNRLDDVLEKTDVLLNIFDGKQEPKAQQAAGSLS